MSTDTRFDLIIIGGGPGGYVAAAHAAQLGMKTACIEKEPRLGGVCLNVGCIPSKALLDSSEYYHLAKEEMALHGVKTGRVSLDLKAMMARKEQVVADLTHNVQRLLERHKVTIIHGHGRLAGPDQVAVTVGKKKKPEHMLSADHILLATGSESIQVPGLEPDGTRIVGSTEALAFDAVPKALGVVGGGYIGLELGSVWQRLGSKVTVIEMLPNIATGLDGQIGRTLERVLKKQGLSFRLKTKVAAAKVVGKKVRATLESGDQQETLSFDRLLVAVGRRPLTGDLGLETAGVTVDAQGRIPVDSAYRTSVASVCAIGDIIAGPMLAHKASAEAIAAVECMAGKAGQVNYDAMPAVVYTWPEVAAVGLTEEAVKAADIPYRKGNFPFIGSGRARCLGATGGLVKLIAHAKTDRLLGAHIIGPRAADMIAECALAIEMGASSEDLARTIHGHPNFSEAIQDAAMSMLT